jgi:hypothetical protein
MVGVAKIGRGRAPAPGRLGRLAVVLCALCACRAAAAAPRQAATAWSPFYSELLEGPGPDKGMKHCRNH